MKCPLRSYFSWLILFIFLVQLNVIFVCCKKPCEIFETNQDSTFWGYLLAALLYPPWIFGTKTMMTDSIFFFTICMVPFLLIIYSQVHIKKFYNQKHVNFWCALVIRICQQFLTPFIFTPMVFRFSYLIEQLFIIRKDIDIKLICSFTICFINILLEILHTYFSAVFLFPIDFVNHSKADYYDGKYMTSLFVIRIILGVISFELSYITNHLVAGIVISLVFFVCFLTLHLRLTYQVHVSAIGQYIEVLPFFVCPFMLLFNYFVHNEIYSLLLLFFLAICFAIIFRIQHYFIVKHCLKAFYPFMVSNKQNIDNNNKEYILPRFFFGSVISVIRIVASEYSDPECLVRFLAYQKKSSEVKNSYIIEVIRFLALFPSRRKECLRELQNFHCKSNFNSFTVFIFKKILKSLDNVESTEKNLVCLNNFYRSFLVHKHLYWVARKNKKFLVSSKEALSAAYFFIEVKNEFHYLMKRYTYDSFLHYYYADFYLSACGDFEEYLNECHIAKMLDNLFYNNNSTSNSFVKNNSIGLNDEIETNSIVDPLLHPMSIVNPKILQFCSYQETLINISPSKKNENLIHRQSSMSNVKKKKTKYEKSSPVATFLNRKKYLIPLLSIFHIYVPIALFLYVISQLYIKDQQIHSESNQLYNCSVQFLNVFYIASTAVYLPYLSNEITKTNPSYDEFNIFLDLPFNISTFFSLIQPLNNMTSGALFLLERYISNHMLDNSTILDIIENIPYDLDYTVQMIFNIVYNKISDLKSHAMILRDIYKNNLDGFYICKVAIITIFCFAFLSLITYIIQINLIYHKEQIKIDFLSSEEIFSLFLHQESKKAWELLRVFVEIPSDNANDDNNNSARSSVILSSFQIPQINKPNQTEKNGIQEPLLEMAVNGHNFNKDLRALINSNKFIKFNATKFKFKLRFKKSKKKKDRYENSDDRTSNSSSNNNTNNNFNYHEEEEDHSPLSQENNNKCKQAIDISKATEKEAFLSCPYFHLVILLSAPLIFAILVIAMFQFPLSSISSTKEETFKEILIGESLANHSLILLNSTFYILEKRTGLLNQRDKYYNQMKELNVLKPIEWKKHFLYEKDQNISKQIKLFQKIMKKIFLNSRKKIHLNIKSDQKENIYGLDEILSDLKPLNSFQSEKCYEFIDVVCTSVENSMNLALDLSTSAILVTQCIPIVYLFSWNLFQDLFFSNVNDLFFMKISNGTSFIVSTVLLMLTVVHISFSSSLLLKKAFNSLFHFPDDFLNPPSNNSKDDSKSENKLPQNALVVTSITASDEIYSVSDNSKEIINRNLNDLISLKMSDTFQKVERSEGCEICEFSINDKKKKTFRFSTEQIGCLTKTVMVEENSPMIENPREQSYIQKLNVFIPPHFAELYGKNDQNEFNYENNFIISVRISNEISPQMIEKCFNAANYISQYSLSIDIISVDGETITFSSVSNCKLIVILLLIRDFNDIVFKNTKIENCIYSVYIHFMDQFWINVVNCDEPYLEFQPYNIEFFRFRLFHVEKGKIAFSSSLSSNFNDISKISDMNKIEIDFDGREEAIYTFPIIDVSSKIKHFV